MAARFAETLAQLKKAAATGRPVEEIDALARSIRVPPDASGDDLAALFTCVPAVLDSVGGFARIVLLDKIEATLHLGRAPAIRFPWNAADAEPYLVPFFDYLDRRFAGVPESIYPIHTEWHVLLNGHAAAKAVLKRYLTNREATGGRPAGHVAGLETAQELRGLFKRIENTDLDAIDDWRRCVSLVEHRNALVRAWAAKCLGALYRVDAPLIVPELPRFPETLVALGDRERQVSAVLGPFIDGYDDSCEGIAALGRDDAIASSGFDVRDFILDVLTRSPAEPYCPDIQSLAFYAHEYFDRDADALKRLLRAGKRDIVVDAMTHEYDFDGRDDVLRALGAPIPSTR